jgi:predicted GNAT family N-acyltransferase
VVFREIAFGTHDYALECRLRDEVLRKPLGLSLSDEDLSGERTQLHFGLFEPGGRMVACVIAAPISENEARIRQMAVSPPHQGKGLGRRVMTEVEAELRRRGFTRFTLRARLSAVGFYEKLGYAAAGGEFVEHGIPHVTMMRAV